MRGWRTSSMGRNRTRSVPLRLLAAGGLALLAAAASLCLGAVSVSPGELLEVLLGNGGGTARSILLLVRALLPELFLPSVLLCCRPVFRWRRH